MVTPDRAIERLPRRRLDVICAGDPLSRAAIPLPVKARRARASAFVNVTRILRAAGLRVGWAAVLEDDRRARALLAEMAARDVEVGAVGLSPVGKDLVVVDASGASSGLGSESSAIQLEIPRSWSSQVLLLSGLSPVTSRLAASCKAARRARREGTAVVLDLVGSLHDWKGHDPRVISTVLREADVVRCSLFDLAVIGTDASAVRRSMRRNATLVFDDGDGATVVGTFGEVRVQALPASTATEIRVESYTAAICVEYARPRRVAETPAARWHRVLRHEAPRLATLGA